MPRGRKRNVQPPVVFDNSPQVTQPEATKEKQPALADPGPKELLYDPVITFTLYAYRPNCGAQDAGEQFCVTLLFKVQ